MESGGRGWAMGARRRPGAAESEPTRTRATSPRRLVPLPLPRPLPPRRWWKDGRVVLRRRRRRRRAGELAGERAGGRAGEATWSSRPLLLPPPPTLAAVPAAAAAAAAPVAAAVAVAPVAAGAACDPPAAPSVRRWRRPSAPPLSRRRHCRCAAAATTAATVGGRRRRRRRLAAAVGARPPLWPTRVAGRPSTPLRPAVTFPHRPWPRGVGGGSPCERSPEETPALCGGWRCGMGDHRGLTVARRLRAARPRPPLFPAASARSPLSLLVAASALVGGGSWRGPDG